MLKLLARLFGSAKAVEEVLPPTLPVRSFEPFAPRVRITYEDADHRDSKGQHKWGLAVSFDDIYVGSLRRYGKEGKHTFIYCPAHGVLPDSPAFTSEEAAKTWLNENWRDYTRDKIDRGKFERDVKRFSENVKRLSEKMES